MEPIFLIVPLLLVVGIFTAGVARSIVRAWLEHRVKLVLLQKYADRPDLFESPDDLRELIERESAGAATQPFQDYRLTGAFLAAIGVGCVVAGRVLAVGDLAVGLYIGGFVCVALGILVSFLGVVLHALSTESAGVPRR